MPFSNKISRFVFILIGLFASLLSNAQNATVSGKITTSDGSAVEDVQVSILNSPLAPVFSTKEGIYSIEIPSESEVILVFSNLSYETVKKTFHPKPGEKISFSPKMNFKNELPEIIKRDENRKTELLFIPPKEYFQIPGGNQDISRLLLAQGLGVVSNNELSTAYSVRGGNFDENLVYVNDIEVYRPQLIRSGQQEGLSFANPDMVSGMNFSAGGFEAKYGDKLSSVLDITYRKPRSFSASAGASLLGGNMHVENITPNKLLSWQIGARYKTNTYILRSIDTKGEYRPRFYDVQSYLHFNFTEKFQLEMLGNISNNKYQVIPQNRETTFGTFNQALAFRVYFDGQEITNINTYFGALSAIYKPKDSLRMKFILSAYRAQENELFTVQGQYYIDELNTDFGSSGFGDVAYTRGIGTYINHGRNYLNATVLNTEHKGRFMKRNNELLWGLRYQNEIISDKMSEWYFVDSAGYSIPQGSSSTLDMPYVLKSRVNLNSGRAMAYIQYVFTKTFRDTSTLTLTAGVRSNYWTLNGQNVVSPRTTLSYKPNWKKDWVFRSSVGYYYQPPFYREMRDFNGKVNTGLKAQQSIHYVLSGDLNFRMWNRPFKFMSAMYYKQMKNLVPYEIDNVRLRYFANNDSRGYATGMDFRLNGEFVKGVESWASMSLMRTQENLQNDFYYTYKDSLGNDWFPGTSQTPVKDSAIHYPGYIPRPTDQWVTFNLFFQDYLPKLPELKMHLSLIFGSGMPVSPPNHKKYLMNDKNRFPFYRRVDIGFSYDLLKEGREKKEGKKQYIRSMWLGLEVWNLLGVNNTVSYTWVKDVTNTQYAIPNYLTNRQLNIKLQVKF